MRVLFILASLIIGLLLTGCGESARIKQEAQKQYDANNPNGDSDFCLYFATTPLIPKLIWMNSR